MYAVRAEAQGAQAMARRNPLIPAPDPDERSRRIAGALFFATCCSVFAVRVLRWEEATIADDPGMLWRALAFTGALMGILLAHELGHYAVARAHGMHLSLPWFIPAPVMVGTFGAIIRLEETPRDRTSLLEMGAAGPLAGLAVVVGLMSWRLSVGGFEGGETLGTPLLWASLSWLSTGEVQPVSTGDPVAFAAWLGCLLTAMNLLPFGQLDGGHVVAALAPRSARAIGWITTLVLLLAGLWWPGWAVWAAALHLLGAREPVSTRRDEGLPGRRALAMAMAALLAFVLCVVPVPL